MYLYIIENKSIFIISLYVGIFYNKNNYIINVIIIL